MNREIKFRAWSDNRIMTYDIQQTKEGISHLVSFGSWLNNKRHIIMQDTELLDKKKAEIWEGDIVYMDDYEANYEIVYKNGRFCCTDNKGKDTFGFSPYSTNEIDDVEVVGNIYENPELMEVNNETT